MRNFKFKRIVAAVCAGTMLIATPAMATQTGTNQLNNSHTTDNTTVKAHVDGPDEVTYIIEIPKEVNFGTLKQPNSSGTSYATTDITVKCIQLDGLQSGQALAVLVKDSEATQNSDPFKLRNGNGAELTYRIADNGGNNIQDLTWYDNGFLFNTYTRAGQEATDTLQLNVGQLYGKDLAIYGGDYTGTLRFHSRIATIGDVFRN